MTTQIHSMACLKSNFIFLVAGYTRVVRRRTLTKWSNVHLATVDASIEDIIDLQDSATTAKLLSVLSGRRIAVPLFEPQRKKRQQVGWINVCSFLESQEFPEEVIGNNQCFYLSLSCVTYLYKENTEI